MFNIFTEVIFLILISILCQYITVAFWRYAFFLIIITGSTTAHHKNNPYGVDASKQTSDQMFAMAATCRRQDF